MVLIVRKLFKHLLKVATGAKLARTFAVDAAT